MAVEFVDGDVMDALAVMPPVSVQCCITSPPYWGLRDYGVVGQLGLEPTSDAYVSSMVQVFRQVYRVLREDGTLWLNLGDSYAAHAGSSRGGPPSASSTLGGHGHYGGGPKLKALRRVPRLTDPKSSVERVGDRPNQQPQIGLKPKNLVGIPWRVAFALQADGWYLRSDIIWSKPNPMPESVTDRPTRSHEYVFLLTKSKRYFYDASAIRNPPSPALVKQVREGYNGQATKDYDAAGVQNPSSVKARIIAGKQRGHSRRHAGFNARWDAMKKADQQVEGSNARSVWSISSQPYAGAHFAAMPEKLIERCLLAGSQSGDLVLDPFAGSGSVGVVADRCNRDAILIDLNPAYIALARERLEKARLRAATGVRS